SWSMNGPSAPDYGDRRGRFSAVCLDRLDGRTRVKIRCTLTWMRKHFLGSFVIVLGLAQGVRAQSRETPASLPPDSKTYETRCGACHGPDLAGASGPSILTYVRFHTDAEMTTAIRARH